MARQPRRWQKIEAHGPGHPLVWLIWGVPALFFLYEFILRISPSLMLPELEQELKINSSEMGASLGAYYYAYAPIQLAVGMLLDRFGSRKLLSLAAFICILGLLVGTQADSASTLAASRFLLGFGSAFAYIGAVYVALIWFPARRAALLTGLTAGVGFAGAVGGEFLLQQIFGSPPDWAHGMWILAIVGIGLAIAMWLAVPERPAWYLKQVGRETPHDLQSVLQGLKQTISNMRIWLVSIGCGMLYLPLAFAGNWGPRDLHTVLGFSEVEAPRLYALFYIGIGIGCPLVGWLSDRSGQRRKWLIMGSIGGIAGAAAMTFLPEDARDLIWWLLPVWGLLVSAYVLGYPLAADLGRRDAAGTAIAFVNFVGMLMAGMMVWLFGIVIDSMAHSNGHAEPEAIDFRWGMGLMTAFMSLALITILLTREPDRKLDP
ncbi:MAG: hypothetical protein CMJ39_02240 [Phycisphaerae bacterium]|nr:hypothetical protein [Phycisphaerae bacterium]